MPEMAYLNFDLEIEKADGGYRAHVLSSPAGEARAAMGPVAAAAPDANPQVVGGALFDALFRDDVLNCLRRSLDARKRADKGLRIRLRLAEVPELAGLPWELMYDRQSASFLALSRETPLVRYLDLPEPAEPMSPEIKLRVLAVIAGPSDYPQLDVDQEWKNLKDGLADLEARGVVTVDRLQPTTVDALQKQLLKQEYHILHFVGHGDYSDDNKDGVLLMTAADGTGDAVSGETFSALLRDQNSLRLALISACRGAVSGDHDPYSGVAQRLVRGGVPAVIAMRSFISDPAAVALAHSFYTALATGAAVDEAVAEARKTLYSGGFPNDWATAVLYMRAADGHLWRQDTEGQRKKRLRLALAAAGAVLAVALVAFLIWSQTGPTQMSAQNTMNIAVLDPGAERADGSTAASPDGELIRSWMVAPLKAANDRAASRAGLWYDGLPRSEKRNALGVLAGSTEAERQANAAKLAEAINADVVVSGRISEAAGKRELIPEFYVFSRLKGEAGETIGYYTLGTPIALAKSLAADSVSREFVSGELAARIDLLDTVLLALQQDTLGRHDEALKLLQGLETKVSPQRPATAPGAQSELQPAGNTAAKAPASAQSAAADSGLDVLYYFLGREKLFLGQSQAAEQDARAALQLNPANVRGHIVLGGALLRQSVAADPATALQPGGLQDQAEAEYQAAVEQANTAYQDALAKGVPASPVYAIARLGLGDALVTRGESLYVGSQTAETDAQAAGVLDKAVGVLDVTVVQLLQGSGQWRMVAQYYAALGSARLYLANLAVARQDTAQAKTFFKDAQASFQTCKAQLDRMPEDRTLKDEIIGAGCTPGLQQVEQGLAQIGGS